MNANFYNAIRSTCIYLQYVVAIARYSGGSRPFPRFQLKPPFVSLLIFITYNKVAREATIDTVTQVEDPRAARTHAPLNAALSLSVPNT